MLIEEGKTLESLSYIWMFWTKYALLDRERTLIEPIGPAISTIAMIEVCKTPKGLSSIRMVWTKYPLIDRETAFV
jgi:hypothetical protein